MAKELPNPRPYHNIFQVTVESIEGYRKQPNLVTEELVAKNILPLAELYELEEPERTFLATMILSNLADYADEWDSLPDILKAYGTFNDRLHKMEPQTFPYFLSTFIELSFGIDQIYNDLLYEGEPEHNFTLNQVLLLVDLFQDRFAKGQSSQP